MRKHRFTPFLLSFLVIVIDQVSKAVIVHTIPEGSVGARLFGDFLWICHVRNDAVAFSFGTGLPEWIKYILFIALPLALMVLLSMAIVSRRADDELTTVQRWCLAGIVGGGIGNLIDRIFRSMRVVDWISTNNYGFLDMERFPTYNIADAAVVLSVIFLIITLLFAKGGKK